MISDNNKRIAKNTLMLYIRMVLLMLVNLYTARIVLQALGVEDYGLYSIVGAVVIFLGFINNSMSAASQRFLSFYQGKGDEEKLSSVFNSILVVQGIISLIILLLGETCGVLYIQYVLNVDASKIPIAHIVYQFSLLSFISKTLNVPYNASIVANERMDAFALISIAEGLLQLIVVFVLQLLPEHRLVAYAAMMFATMVIIQCCYHIYSAYHFKECKIRRNWDKVVIREIFAYSGWNLLASLSVVLVQQGVNMILNSFFGVIVNAARGISFQVNGAIASLSGSFQQSINPQIIKSYAEKEREKMYALVMNGTRFSFYLLLVLIVPVFFNMKSLLQLWLGNVPPYTEMFCRLVLLNHFSVVLADSLRVGTMATGRIRNFQVVISVLYMLNVPLSIIGLYIYPNPYLTAYIMIGLYILAFIASLIIASQIIGMSIMVFIKKTLIPVLSVMSLSFLCACIIDKLIVNSSIIILTGRMIAMVIMSFIVIYFVGITNKERIAAVNFIKKKMKRFKF